MARECSHIIFPRAPQSFFNVVLLSQPVVKCTVDPGNDDEKWINVPGDRKRRDLENEVGITLCRVDVQCCGYPEKYSCGFK